jgi:hypothetical protein
MMVGLFAARGASQEAIRHREATLDLMQSSFFRLI